MFCVGNHVDAKPAGLRLGAVSRHRVGRLGCEHRVEVGLIAAVADHRVDGHPVDLDVLCAASSPRPSISDGAAPGRAGPGEPDADRGPRTCTCTGCRGTRASRCARCARRCSSAIAEDGRHDLDDYGPRLRTDREAGHLDFSAPTIDIILSAGGLRHHEIDRAAPACSLDTSGLSTARRFPVEAR